jgi:hypothetical protein
MAIWAIDQMIKEETEKLLSVQLSLRETNSNLKTAWTDNLSANEVKDLKRRAHELEIREREIERRLNKLYRRSQDVVGSPNLKTTA